MTDLQPAGAWGHSEAAQPQTLAPPRNSGSGTAPIRPRIGTGPRTRRRRRTRIDGGVIVRSVGISAAVLVAVFGGLLALHLFAPPRPAVAVADIPAVAPTAKYATASAQRGTEPPAAAMRAAAVLNSARAEAAPGAEGEPSTHEAAATAPSPVESTVSAAASAPAPQGPTPADFARPAFLEPPAPAARVAAEGDEDETVAAATPIPAPATQSRDGDVTASVRRTGRISSAINLRSAPRRGAEVLGTLEAGTKVDIFSCKSWCEVAADGKRGYVYARAVDQ